MKSRAATEADENDFTELRLNGDDTKLSLAEAWAVEATIVAIAMVDWRCETMARLWRCELGFAATAASRLVTVLRCPVFQGPASGRGR